MNIEKELELIDAIINFKIKTIPESTRFWMIRTQKGYFYHEFITRKFVAVAWNSIDQSTDFSEEYKERLKDSIILEYPEIKRPSTVINKCQNFINEIKSGDILVIPSEGRKYLTFAIAGEYFEDSTKTVELENKIIFRIRNNDVDVNDVSCPYKKRRHITLLRTIKSDEINSSLYRALSNYHGISNLDSYAYQILNELYNVYTFRDSTVLVYSIRKSSPIKPRELGRFIYGNTECLCKTIHEDQLATQMSLHSPGDVIYILQNAYDLAKDNWTFVLGLLVILGGGSALSFQVPGVFDVLKKALSTKEDIRAMKLDNDIKETELQLKRLELHKKIKDSGIEPESLIAPLEAVYNSAISLKAEPIILSDEVKVTDDAIEESIDIDEE